MIKAVIFDMDGLLIDSEPFWVEAEIKVLSQLGVPLTPKMTAQTTGLREDEVVAYWYKQYPWHDMAINEVADKVERRVVELIRKHGKAMPGVYSTIEICLSKGLSLAIASSSSLLLIDTVMNQLEITKDISVVCSAYSVPLGKPDPAVYLKALHELNRICDGDIKAEECLVLEDSLNGVSAAMAANMKCIAVPSAELQDDKGFNIADSILHSLRDFTTQILEDS